MGVHRFDLASTWVSHSMQLLVPLRMRLGDGSDESAMCTAGERKAERTNGQYPTEIIADDEKDRWRTRRQRPKFRPKFREEELLLIEVARQILMIIRRHHDASGMIRPHALRVAFFVESRFQVVQHA